MINGTWHHGCGRIRVNTQIAESRTKWTTLLATAATLFFIPPSAANAQCGGWVHDFASYGSLFPGYYFASPTLLDRDGEEGAQLPRIVGFFTGMWNFSGEPTQLVMLGDEDWIWIADVPPGINGSIAAWDPDGAGPALSRVFYALIAPDITGSYLTSRPWPRNATGSHPFAPVTSPVYALTTWDPDGAGPERETIVIGIGDPSAPARTTVLMWNGSIWQPLGEPVLGIGRSFTMQRTSPGEPRRLILYGSGGAVYSYHGESWTRIDMGAFNGQQVRDIKPWDHDGDKATAEWLVVRSEPNGPISDPDAMALAIYDGTAWSRLSSTTITQIAPYVRASNGRPELLVAGHFGPPPNYAPSYRAFDGTSWRSIGEPPSGAILNGAAISWDPDGPLSTPPVALVQSNQMHMGDVRGNGLFVWNGDEWRPAVPSIVSTSPAQGWWDTDGDGPARPRLAVVSPSGRTTRGTLEISTWDGVDWSIADTGIPSTGYWGNRVTCLASWDPDGDGPQDPILIIGGRFNVATPSGHDIINVAGWNGESLVPLGEGLMTNGQPIDGLISWDSDGAGPESPRLYAYGSITGSGTDSFNSVAQFDGERWTPLGDGVWPESPSAINCVHKLATWDPDLEGPSEEVLLLGGRFSLFEGGPLAPLASWNGTSLQPFAGPTPPAGLKTIGQLASVPDARSGTPRPALLAGHASVHDCWNDPEWQSSGCNSSSTTYLLRDGAWSTFAQYSYGYSSSDDYYYESGARPPNVITRHDPDGPGPRREHLIYGQSYSYGVPHNVSSFGFPDSTPFVGGPVAYEDYGTPYFLNYTRMNSVVSMPLLSDLSIASYAGNFYELVTTNSYTDPANPPRPIEGIARWMEGPPRILDIPEPRTNHETRAFALTVRAIGGGDLGYQWTFNGTPLKVGPTERGSIVHSPGGPTLIISNASHLDQGQYVCRISNTCGSTFSPTLSMPDIGCKADVNHDGLLDILDFLDFMHAFGECDGLPGPCGGTPNADFNGDTLVDIIDLLDFVDAFGTGCDE